MLGVSRSVRAAPAFRALRAVYRTDLHISVSWSGAPALNTTALSPQLQPCKRKEEKKPDIISIFAIVTS